MKKYLIFLTIISLCLVGCGSYGEKDIVKDFSKKINDTNGYYINGELEIVNNEDSYLYDVEVAYQKENNFKVVLKNKTNNHEQVILKNSDGVYVLTPSLNKSFKFQSEWPYNNSQSYILQTILKDLESDTEKTFEEKDDSYIFTTKVNYSNNSELVKQQITLDKDLNLKSVVVLNSNDEIKMKMTFNTIDYKATYDDTYFMVSSNVSNTIDETSQTLDSIIYPMYVPNNTQLSGQEKLKTENGERIILTFSGENPFTIVQETVNPTSELLTIPMYGEPQIITDTVGAVSEDSISWISNGVEFYVVSDKLDSEEMLEVANSINTLPIGK
ncbi:MAG TPA: outer membrane lipoprotein carrier protein LolA [Candidatus Faecisoma merdavium]|nr:outer membrane lipoprotein carrier protein LolA [Candidatus Faecisoma merdavium]